MCISEIVNNNYTALYNKKAHPALPDVPQVDIPAGTFGVGPCVFQDPIDRSREICNIIGDEKAKEIQQKLTPSINYLAVRQGLVVPCVPFLFTAEKRKFTAILEVENMQESGLTVAKLVRRVTAKFNESVRDFYLGLGLAEDDSIEHQIEEKGGSGQLLYFTNELHVKNYYEHWLKVSKTRRLLDNMRRTGGTDMWKMLKDTIGTIVTTTGTLMSVSDGAAGAVSTGIDNCQAADSHHDDPDSHLDDDDATSTAQGSAATAGGEADCASGDHPPPTSEATAPRHGAGNDETRATSTIIAGSKESADEGQNSQREPILTSRQECLQMLRSLNWPAWCDTAKFATVLDNIGDDDLAKATVDLCKINSDALRAFFNTFIGTPSNSVVQLERPPSPLLPPQAATPVGDGSAAAVSTSAEQPASTPKKKWTRDGFTAPNICSTCWHFRDGELKIYHVRKGVPKNGSKPCTCPEEHKRKVDGQDLPDVVSTRNLAKKRRQGLLEAMKDGAPHPAVDDHSLGCYRCRFNLPHGPPQAED